MATPLPKNIQDYQGRKSMSMEQRDIKLFKDFHRLLRRTLKPNVYSIYCAIEDRAGPTEKNDLPAFTCFASHSTLAYDSNTSRMAVIRAIEDLATRKLIRTEDREGFTSLIWPLISNQEWLHYIEVNDPSQPDTSTTEKQGVYQAGTGGYTNVVHKRTTLTNQIKEIPIPNGIGPTTIDLPDCVPIENLSTAYSSRQEVTTPGPTNSNQDRGDVRSHIPPVSTPEPKLKAVPKPGKPKDKKDENPFTKDPRLKIWKQIAEGEGYKYWPTRESQKLVYDHIPPNQVIRWEATIRAWLRKNHKVHNIEGMVKVFWFGFDAFYKGDADKRPLPVVEQIAESELAHAST